MLKNIFPSAKQRCLLSLSLCVFSCVLQSFAQSQPQDAPPGPPVPVELITVQQAHELIGGPTLITLDFDNAAPQVVYEELFRQAKIAPHIGRRYFRLPSIIPSTASAPKGQSFKAVSLWPDAFWKEHNKLLTAHFARKPFWAAVRELESRTGLTLYCFNAAKGYALVPLQEAKESYANMYGPSMMSDSFEVIAGQMTWWQTRSLRLSPQPIGDDIETATDISDNGRRGFTLYVLPDPKFAWISAAGVKMEEAEDEKGNSLLPRGDTTLSGVPGGAPFGFPVCAAFNLMRPNGSSRALEGASRKIARLRGKLRLVFLSASETWEVPDPLRAKQMTKELRFSEGKEQFSIAPLEAHGNSLRTSYTIVRQVPAQPVASSFSVDGTGPMNRSDLIYTNLDHALSLVDADGTVYRARSEGGAGSTYRSTYYVSFERPAGFKDHPPTKLVWELPREWKEVEVPFEFTDLPLP